MRNLKRKKLTLIAALSYSSSKDNTLPTGGCEAF